MPVAKRRSRGRGQVRDYDEVDTTGFIDPADALRFEDLGLRLPDTPPTQVISIRLPSRLLNQIRAISSERDIPYQALIKLLLAKSVENLKYRPERRTRIAQRARSR